MVTVISDEAWDSLALRKEVATEFEAFREENTGVCGVCYRIDDSNVDEVLANLDFREKGGYSRSLVNVSLDNGKTVQALLYTANTSNPNFESNLTMAQCADRISIAVGPSGPNTEYLFELDAFFKSLPGQEDKYIACLAAMVVQRLSVGRSRI